MAFRLLQAKEVPRPRRPRPSGLVPRLARASGSRVAGPVQNAYAAEMAADTPMGRLLARRAWTSAASRVRRPA